MVKKSVINQSCLRCVLQQLIGVSTVITRTPETQDTHLIILSIINRDLSSTTRFAFVWLAVALKISDMAHALVRAPWQSMAMQIIVIAGRNHMHTPPPPSSHSTRDWRKPNGMPQTEKTPTPKTQKPTLSMQFPHKFVAAADPKSCAASVMSFNHN